MARVQKGKQSPKAPPMDKLLKPAVGVAFAVMAYYVMQGSENVCIIISLLFFIS
jgi:hypothetical protein